MLLCIGGLIGLLALAGGRKSCSPGQSPNAEEFRFVMANGLNYKLWKPQFHTARDALADREPMDYLVKGIIPLPSLNMFYGASGTLKTNLVLDMAICVAMGKKWLTETDGNGGYETKKNPVLWVDADSGIRALDIRIGAMLRAYGGNVKVPIHYASFLTPAFEACQDSRSVYEMIEMIGDLKARMVVFDNLGTFSGGKDEISSQMIQVMSNFRLISEKTGSAVELIHHAPKNEGNGERRTPRGHTSIEAALDYAFGIRRDGDIIQIETTKVRHWNIDSMAAMWTYEHKPGTPDLHLARFFGAEAEVPEKVLQAREAIMACLREAKTANQSELIEYGSEQKPKVSKSRILSELNWLLSREKVVSLPAKAHNSKEYKLR